MPKVIKDVQKTTALSQVSVGQHLLNAVQNEDLHHGDITGRNDFRERGFRCYIQVYSAKQEHSLCGQTSGCIYQLCDIGQVISFL